MLVIYSYHGLPDDKSVLVSLMSKSPSVKFLLSTCCNFSYFRGNAFGNGALPFPDLYNAELDDQIFHKSNIVFEIENDQLPLVQACAYQLREVV
jgi:hypothetical protein